MSNQDETPTTPPSDSSTPLKKSYFTPVLITLCVLAAILILVIIAGRSPFLSFTPRHFLIGLGFLSVAGAIAAGGIYRNNVSNDPEAVIPATVTLNIEIFVSLGLVVVSIFTASTAASWTASIIWSLAVLLSGGAVGFLFGIPRSRTGKSLVSNTGQPEPTPDKASSTTVTQSGTQPDTTTAATGTQINAQSATPDTTTAATGTQNNAQSAKPSTPTATPDTPQNVAPPTSDGSETALEQISDWLTKIIVGVGLTNLKQLPAQLDRLGWYVGRSIDANHPNQFLAVGIVIYFCALGVISGYLITQLYLLKLVNRLS